MKVKRNDSTVNRPWGERVIDAPFLPVDLHAYTQQLMEEEAWQKNDRNAITVAKTDAFTVVLIALHKEAEMKPATADGIGIMTLQVLDGRITFKTGQEDLEINRGQMITLHEHTSYKVIALEETVCLLTMARENDNHVPSPIH